MGIYLKHAEHDSFNMYLSEFDQNMQNMIVSKCILWEFDQNMQNMIVSSEICWNLIKT